MKAIFISLFLQAGFFLTGVFSFSAFGVVGEETFYQILDVSESADPEEIEQAWKKRRFHVHPDRNPDDPLAAKRFHDLQTAYQTLRNPLERKSYDKELGRLRRFGRLPPKQEEPAKPSINEEIRQAAGVAAEKLNRARSEEGDKAAAGSLSDAAFQKQRDGTDRELKKELETVFLNASAGSGGQSGGAPLIIPEEILSFPQSLSFLLERGADAAFAPEGKKSALEQSLVSESEPDALRVILRHNKDYINRKSSQGTPLLSLILKRIRHSLNKGDESAASAWQALADDIYRFDLKNQETRRRENPPGPPYQGGRRLSEKPENSSQTGILSEGAADLSLQDAKGATVLETAVTHRLNETAVQIYFRRQAAEDLLLESESRKRLMPAARKADNFPMIEFLKTDAALEDALTEYAGREGPDKMTPSRKAELRKMILAAGIVLASSAFGVHVESGHESDWPLWLRTLPYSALSFIPAGLLLRSKMSAEEKEENKRNWKEFLREEREAGRTGIEAHVRLAAEILRRTGVKLKEAEIKATTARIVRKTSEFLKKANELGKKHSSPAFNAAGKKIDRKMLARDLVGFTDWFVIIGTAGVTATIMFKSGNILYGLPLHAAVLYLLTSPLYEKALRGLENKIAGRPSSDGQGFYGGGYGTIGRVKAVSACYKMFQKGKKGKGLHQREGRPPPPKAAQRIRSIPQTLRGNPKSLLKDS